MEVECRYSKKRNSFYRVQNIEFQSEKIVDTKILVVDYIL
jgi:hypothetical protein